MSLETFIEKMPKVALHVQLEGAIRAKTLLRIAEQNNIAATMKARTYDKWLRDFEDPDYDRIDEIARETASWVRHPDDLARIVYDLGVYLSHQNVKYAEISVLPALYTDLDMSFDAFLNAINDGRDRAERAWNVQIRWILSIPRDRPRKGDDIARWAISASGRKGGIVGLGMVGQEDAYHAGQFVKPYHTAVKRELGRVCHAHITPDAPETIQEIVETLDPMRLTDVTGIEGDPETLDYLIEKNMPIVLTPARWLCMNHYASREDMPLRQLYDAGLEIILATGMPELFRTTLNDEYLAAVQHSQLTVENLEKIALNAVIHSFLPEDEKAEMVSEFVATYTDLREEYLQPDA